MCEFTLTLYHNASLFVTPLPQILSKKQLLVERTSDSFLWSCVNTSEQLGSLFSRFFCTTPINIKSEF